MKPAFHIAAFCVIAFLAANALAQEQAENPSDVLVGTLRVHPKFHYRYYIDGFGDGQECALFGADKRLEKIEVGSVIRVEGDLASKRFGGDPDDKRSALPQTWIIYMNVEKLETLRGPIERSASPPRQSK